MTDQRPTAGLTCDEARDLAAGFVLGALDPDEMAAVRDHLATCPEAHPEFAELGGTAGYLAESLAPAEPSGALGGRIVAAVAAEAAGAAAADRVAPATAAVAATDRPLAGAEDGAADTAGGVAPTGAVVSLDAERVRRRPVLAWAGAIAAVLLIAALGAWNVSLRRDADAAQAYAVAVDRVLAVAAAPGGQAAILAPAVPGGPSGLAGIGPDGSVEIAMRGLAPTTGTQVYEAWVVGSDGVPVAIGSFTPNGAGYGGLATASPTSAPGVTIGLTLEPTAGRTTPTPPMLSSGMTSGST